MRNVFLEGKRIYLRTLEEKDLRGNYVSWLNDEQVSKYNSHHVFPYSFEEGLSYIRKSQKTKDTLVLTIIVKNGDVHIGNIALQKIDYVSRNAEFAILVGEKKYWNKGYSKEASFLVLNHAFRALNLHRIYCGSFKENVAMKRLTGFLGMRQEGLRRQAIYKNGKFNDVVEYGVLKSEFYRLQKTANL